MNRVYALAGGTLLAVAVSSAVGTGSASAQTPATEPAYQVSDLGALGGVSSGARGIDDAGHVVGTWNLYDPGRGYFLRAFLHRDGAMTDLGCLPDQRVCEAFAVNSRGQVVGQANNNAAPLRFRPFLYENGVMSDITPTDLPEAYASDINEAGQVVGWARVAISPYADVMRAFYFSGGAGTDLGRFGTSSYEQSNATAINNNGLITGYFTGTATGYGAFVYSLSDGSKSTIPVPCGATPCYVQPSDINDRGQIVGYYSAGPGLSHPFLYDHGTGEFLDLGSLGGRSSWAFGVNAHGQAVGYSQDAAGYLRAFLYKDGAIHDLQTMIPADSGWTLHGAYDINDAGQIVGGGYHDGVYRAFLMTPFVPTPEGVIADLITLIEGLDLGGGKETSLVSKLESALKSLETGNTEAACGQVGAFVNQVEALSEDSLTPEQAQELIARAEEALRLLGC